MKQALKNTITHSTQAEKTTIDLSIVVPAFNEENRISTTLQKIITYFSTSEKIIEIHVVNDGSTDQTSQVVQKFQSLYPFIHLVEIPKNRGKGYAVKKGMELAQGRFILFTDADNSTPIQEIEKLFDGIMEADIAIGSRYLSSSKIHIRQRFARRFVASTANMINNLTPLRNIHDPRCGFKLFRNAAAKEIIQRQRIFRFGFDTEILLIAKYHNFKIQEVPIEWSDTADSKLKIRHHLVHTCYEMLQSVIYFYAGLYK